MVAENDRLLVLEAMKMMNMITASAGGVVKKINVKPGDKVANGTVLLEID
jgi:biotin carboxyl carrier protein